MGKEHLCTACNEPHVAQEAHKESVDKRKLLMLRAAADWVIANGVNDFKKKDLDLLRLGQSAYGCFGALRYHALIAKVRDPNTKKPIKGRWLVTRQGWAFLRGELRISKYVLVRDNHVVPNSHSTKMLGIKDVYYGSDIITTHFEYFDDDGKMVAVRPEYDKPNLQGALFNIEPLKQERKIFI